jgi:hypothetical protein
MMVKILPLPSAGWRVELSPGSQPFVFPTKAQAVAFAITWAENHPPCGIRVYSRTGDLERTMTFPNGTHRRVPGSDRRRVQIDIPFPDRRRGERRKTDSTTLSLE